VKILEQIGFVSKVEGDFVQVDIKRASSCGDNCGSCGSSCNIPGLRINVKNDLGAKLGDFVEVEMSTKSILNSAFIVYMIPLIMMILGISLGAYIFKTMGYKNYEIFGMLAGVFSLVISFMLLKIIDKRVKENKSLTFEMVKIKEY